jgi:hypothetical protein
MDIRQVLAACVETGLRFSIELDGRSVVVKLGDYLRQQTGGITFDSFDEAVDWLRRHCDVAVTSP